MPWNEPGNSGNNKPNNNRPNNNRPGGNKPPEFDQILSDLFNSIKRAFGGGSNNSGGAKGSQAPVLILIIGLLGLTLYSSAYQIQQAERGVVLVFGEYSHTMQPGLRFTLPRPFAQVLRVNVDTIRQEDNSGQMLTEDKNLIEIDYSLQYRIDEERVNDYLFSVTNPENTVKQVSESVMRQVAGTRTLDFIINENRTAVNQEARAEVQSMLNQYKTGVQITQLNITEVHPPSNVKEAFDDVVKAREDQKTFINQAKEYENARIPEAEGRVLKILQEAEGYKASIIAEAAGKADRFDLLRSEYEQAPEVTRQRLFLETMESVLGDTSKVVMDQNSGNSMMYLPLDQLMKNQPRRMTNDTLDLGTSVVTPQTNNMQNSNTNRNNNRTTRRGRGGQQ
ncbi:FtsH protease activity modulator HflK [Marinicella sp. S1101]|uniref:FtsH protease activity modulator HflK n=1 Tax=Marinicella marina TaxID=2996016 RepID=UPI002260BE96|nr:FtsH protease activity modulator HflK [Marinicella marina]MCX7553259.1 FtsH protease activity modulator HflK [Marinicella marina]MDJ1138991.1 FtsH protease activity modulator HflK [Marinicella marina]